MTDPPTPVQFDLQALANADGTGPVFGHETEDLDLTFLRWKGGHRIAAHVNDEVDVVMIVADGEGQAIVNGAPFPLEQGKALLIPKGSQREIVCGEAGMAYLNVHKRRRRLMPLPGGRPK